MSLTARQRADLAKAAKKFERDTGVTWAELSGTGRHSAVSHPRQDFMLRLHRQRWSLTDIGIALKRNHTTVMYGVHEAREREKLASQRRECAAKAKEGRSA